jgi:mRNA interferase MazF
VQHERSGGNARPEINRGDIYWIQPQTGESAPPGDYPHPYVVIQENVLNRSRLDTVVVCAVTSNLQRAGWPGNVLLEEGEGDLPRQSVVEVSKVTSVKKSLLGGYAGSLSAERVDQILAGMRLLQTTFYR